MKPGLVLAAAGLLSAGSAHATTEIATTARGLFSNVRVVGTSATLVGPLAQASGRTSPGYALNAALASSSNNVALGNTGGVSAALGLVTGAIATAASANGTTPANTTSGSASASVNDLAINLTTSLLGVPTSVLSLTAGQVQSLSSISTAGGIATINGSSQFSNLNLLVGGQSLFTLGSNQQVAPNFIAYSTDGLQVMLNQQFVSIFQNTRLIITNAIGISFTNYLLDGRRISGTVTVGQSAAEYVGNAPVPEAATWAQMIAGFGLMGAAARRRRAARARAAA